MIAGWANNRGQDEGSVNRSAASRKIINKKARTAFSRFSGALRGSGEMAWAVLENIRAPLRARNMPEAERRSRSMTILDYRRAGRLSERLSQGAFRRDEAARRIRALVVEQSGTDETSLHRCHDLASWLRGTSRIKARAERFYLPGERLFCASPTSAAPALLSCESPAFP